MTTEQADNVDPFQAYADLDKQLADAIATQAAHVERNRKVLTNSIVTLDRMVARAVDDLKRPRTQLGMPVNKIAASLERHRHRNGHTPKPRKAKDGDK